MILCVLFLGEMELDPVLSMFTLTKKEREITFANT